MEQNFKLTVPSMGDAVSDNLRSEVAAAKLVTMVELVGIDVISKRTLCDRVCKKLNCSSPVASLAVFDLIDYGYITTTKDLLLQTTPATRKGEHLNG